MKLFSTSACFLLAAATAGVSAFTAPQQHQQQRSVVVAVQPFTSTTFGLVVSQQQHAAASTTTSQTQLSMSSIGGRKATFEDYTTLKSDDDVRGLFNLWNDALATGDSRLVAARYSTEATSALLLPTVSDTPRNSYESIRDYFDAFLLRQPKGTILESFVQRGENWAQDSGIYEFTMGVDGSKVKARYTFFYVLENGSWKIQHHHSSIMPESIAVPTPISEEEVRSLFYLWNDALATLDPEVVADRYTDDAVLLPTVSDIPRADRSSITDYFVNFTKLQPQGTILESYVQIGTNWCKDSGIYEFTMGATGQVVRARYSFIYEYDAASGSWKIAHHHSSQMPEQIMPKKPAGSENILKPEEVRALFQNWNSALATLDPSKVAKCYSKEAILLPTVSDEPRTSEDRITEYFVNFLQNKPQGVITEGKTTSGDGWCKDAGIYEFTMGSTGDKVLARYSFVYVFEDGEWKIAHHHSSVMPEGLLEAQRKKSEAEVLGPEQVRGLFQLWNNALATLDPEQVAARYSKNAILLPTVSDTPRTTKESITDYFVNFLKNKPQGVITEGQILSGEDWCKDAGVYKFTMGVDGSEVEARYSFVYIKEDGEWKIAHHHSSAMPEALLSATAKVKELETLFGGAL
mmetsp:Transcript_26828/g.63985  ORF Transcript_26828/g.63985 Transcript_26828/m.63985 type:complete len:633 (-) Transcript_26828:67-1965(-)